MHLDPDYPHFWILVTPQEMIGPFYAEQAAKDWASERGLDPKWIEKVTFTRRWDEVNQCPMKEAEHNPKH